MKEYLFICHGNVGRSQMAEAFYNYFTKSRGAISAGIQDVSKKYDGHPSKEIVQVMREVKIDVSQQVVKQINKKILSQARKIVVFCDESLCSSEIRSKTNVQYIKIEDPYGSSVEQTRKTRNEIEILVRNLIKQSSSQLYLGYKKLCLHSTKEFLT